MSSGCMCQGCLLLFAGVHLKNGKTLQADLVVDATGKDSNVSKWLKKLGQAVPDTISVASGLRYTYRMYEMTDDPERDWSVGVCMDHPEYNRTAVVIPVETDKWIVSLQCSSQCTSHTLLQGCATSESSSGHLSCNVEHIIPCCCIQP